MKLLPLLAGALVAAATLTGSAVAMADEAPLDCAAALTAFQDASKAADAAKADDVAAADAQKLYDTLDAAQIELAAAVKQDNATIPPLSADSQRTKDAKAALVKAQAAVTAFEAKGVKIETLRDTAAKNDAAALVKAADKARATATDACKGADGTPGVVFANCSEVRDAGKAPLGKDQPGYRLGLDSDGDGVACEIDDVPVPTKIDTGRA